MPFFLFALGIIVGASGIVTRAEAQNYPWCAYLRAGGTNCGFSTFDQCMATLAGIGGSCMQNTQYQAPAAAARAHAAARAFGKNRSRSRKKNWLRRSRSEPLGRFHQRYAELIHQHVRRISRRRNPPPRDSAT